MLEGDVVTNFYIVTAGRASLERGGAVIGALRTAEWTEVRSLSISRFRQLIGQFPAAKHTLIQRIVDNILEQNKLKHGTGTATHSPSKGKRAKHEIVTLHELDADADASTSLD